MSAKVLNFGSINIDHVYRVAHFVQPGETQASMSLTTVLGGKGANQSAATAQAGCLVAHIGQLGTVDSWCIKELAALGVDTGYISLVDGSSGHAIIQVNDAGENAIVLHGGANRSLQITQLEAAMQDNPSAEYLLLQNEVNDIGDAIELAHARQLKIVFNPAPMDKSVVHLPLDKIHTLILNQGEAQQLSGLNKPEMALDYLARKFSDTRIIITLGANGAVWQKGAERQHCASPKVTPIDTTGAGDTFVGYFVAGLVDQLETKMNLHRACKAAAIATTTAGAIPSIPRLDDVIAKEI